MRNISTETRLQKFDFPSQMPPVSTHAKAHSAKMVGKKPTKMGQFQISTINAIFSPGTRIAPPSGHAAKPMASPIPLQQRWHTPLRLSQRMRAQRRKRGSEKGVHPREHTLRCAWGRGASLWRLPCRILSHDSSHRCLSPPFSGAQSPDVSTGAGTTSQA